MFRTLAIDIVADVVDQNGKYIQPHQFKKGELLYVWRMDKGLMFFLGIDRYVYFREDHFLPESDTSAQKVNKIFELAKEYKYDPFEKWGDSLNYINKI